MSDRDANAMQQQPIIGFVVDNDEPVVLCVGCTSKEDNCVDKIRDGEDYGTTIPYPECNGCGEALRPNSSQIDANTSNPHEDDFCVVCKRGPDCGETMNPVRTIDNGCVCSKCITSAEGLIPWGVSDV